MVREFSGSNLGGCNCFSPGLSFESTSSDISQLMFFTAIVRQNRKMRIGQKFVHCYHLILQSVVTDGVTDGGVKSNQKQAKQIIR